MLQEGARFGKLPLQISPPLNLLRAGMVMVRNRLVCTSAQRPCRCSSYATINT
jgi:hypothetical protein